MMAILTGNDGKVVVGTTTLAAVRNFSVEMTADTIETSVMGTSNRTYIKGMSTWSGSADIYFEDAEFKTAEATFNPAISSTNVGDAPIAVKLVVQDDASNDKWFSGNIIVTGYTVNSTMDGMVEASIAFQGSGPCAFTNTGSYSA
jgi:predicted secreted protein